MADKVQVLTTGITFTAEGVLVPPNTPISVDADIADAEAEKKKESEKALVPLDDNYVPPKPVQVAAIGPTGPNPTQPQALPPGAIQTLGGYTDAAGNQLVPETTRADALTEPTVEEGGPSATGSDDSEDDDDASPLDQSVTKLTTYLNGVDDTAEIDKLIADEKAGQNRAGALKALDDRKEALALS